MAFGAMAFAEEDILAGQLLRSRLGGIQMPCGSNFGAGGKSMMFCICAIIGT